MPAESVCAAHSAVTEDVGTSPSRRAAWRKDYTIPRALKRGPVWSRAAAHSAETDSRNARRGSNAKEVRYSRDVRFPRKRQYSGRSGLAASGPNRGASAIAQGIVQSPRRCVRGFKACRFNAPIVADRPLSGTNRRMRNATDPTTV